MGFTTTDLSTQLNTDIRTFDSTQLLQLKQKKARRIMPLTYGEIILFLFSGWKKF